MAKSPIDTFSDDCRSRYHQASRPVQAVSTVSMQLPSCRSCHALTGASHSGIAKSVASKGYGPSPGAKQGCSNLSGRHRPSAICSNAVRAKLPVKNRSSVSKSLSANLTGVQARGG